MPQPKDIEAARQRALVARQWKPNPTLERVIALRKTNPDMPISAAQRMSLGYYLKDKAIAEAEGIDVSYTPPKGESRWDDAVPKPDPDEDDE